MKTRKSKPARPASSAVPADHALLSFDVREWAGERIAHAGHESALLGKVASLRLAADGRSVEGKVRDQGPTPYRVSVALVDESLEARCECPYEEGPVCKHAVAVIEALRFPRPALVQVAGSQRRARRAGRLARGQGRIVTHAPMQTGMLLAAPGEWALTRDERVDLAREEELKARKQRARKERPTITRLGRQRGVIPRFRVAGHGRSGPYTVALRGSEARLASCTCPDYEKSEIGTCKHIERVRSWYQRQTKKPQAPALAIWWRPAEWLAGVPDALREIRCDAVETYPPGGLRTWFDGEGSLLPAPADTPALTWIESAIVAARQMAEDGGLAFDLDPAVTARIDEAREQAELSARLRAVEVGDPVWNEAITGLGFQLHPYQAEGAVFLAQSGRAFLADDMGLGKTLQAIVATLLMRRTAGIAKTLVVCPASLKHQWAGEILKACGEKARVVEGSRALRARTYRRWKRGFLVLNYELALRDLDLVRAAKAELVVLDEAQRIKNWDTKTAKAVKELQSPFAFVLTGTPLENRLSELHSIVEFLNPRALGPRWRLLPFHAVTEPGGKIVAYESLDVLRSRLAGFFMRRERVEVLDQLPPRTDNTFWTEMTPAQLRPYRRHARKVAALLAQNRPLKTAEVRLLLQSLTSMRILCNAWAQYEWESSEGRLKDGHGADGDLRWIHSPKLEEFTHVLEDLLERPGAKVLVFSQWERLLRLAHYAVRPLLERRGETATVFHGGMDSRARLLMIEGFKNDPARRVLFSTDAGGLGLNLQDAASVVVNLEVPWNPAVLEQRIGRVHRMGQRKSVQVLHFVTRGAIEERVRQVVENKKALFDGLLVDEVDRVVLDEAVQASFVERVRSLMTA
ncbi:MAG TPA: SNF2-related protein [Candidatus Polarisedimenticolaceae bacterium]|nr:SNF2-related protein [Candidatus Polarisedimenticolaceae bacterium]